MIGEFRSGDRNFKCYIFLDDDEVLRSNMREIFVTYQKEESGLAYYIIITSNMLKKTLRSTWILP